MKSLIIASIVQGATEFLPISSSSHVHVVKKIFSLPTLSKKIEVFLHIGTLLAVLVYFWRDILTMLEGFLSLLKGRITGGFSLALKLVLATLPLVIVGYFYTRYSMPLANTMHVIGWASIFSAIVLFTVDAQVPENKTIESLNYFQVLTIGVLQILSIIPGTSRLGVTITAARLFGLKRTEAARFSLLLSIPAVVGAVTLLFINGSHKNAWAYSPQMFTALGIAAFVGLAILTAFMLYLKNYSFKVFAVYRILFGVFVLYTF